MIKKHLIAASLLITVLTARGGDMTDNDGDGLPDLWEAPFGLSTNSAAGIDGAAGDPDNDGLSNAAEFMAGVYVIGANTYSNHPFCWTLSPTNAFSASTNFLDRFYRPTGSRVPLGWMFSDGDFIDDSWESVPSNGVSRFEFEESAVRSGGWTDWDRCRMSLAKVARPSINIELSYNGPSEDGPVTVYGYHDVGMPPDVVYQVPSMNSSSLCATPVSGALRRDTRWWKAIKGGSWSDGTPLGNCESTACGWSRNNVRIELTNFDYSFPRLSISAPAGRPIGKGAASYSRVRILRLLVDGLANYQRIVADYKYHAEAVFCDDVNSRWDGIYWEYGLDWGLPDVSTGMSREFVVYEVWVGDAPTFTNNTRRLTFTNDLSSARAFAALKTPSCGARVFSLRPRFCWTQLSAYVGTSWTEDGEFGAFRLQLSQGSTNGPVVYDSGLLRVPPRDNSGLYEWTAPFNVGDLLESGYRFFHSTNYAWRIALYSPKFSETDTASWSEWSTFRMEPSALTGTILATVKYFGPATNLSGKVKLEVLSSPDFLPCPDPSRSPPEYSLPSIFKAPDFRYTFYDSELPAVTNSTGSTNCVLRGLSAGTYYVRAYIDSNANGVRDSWESWGYANHVGLPGSPYDPIPIIVSESARPAPATVIIEDCDVDNDGYPDAWEYEQHPQADFLSLSGPSPLGRINPLLQ